MQGQPIAARDNLERQRAYGVGSGGVAVITLGRTTG